MRRQWLPSAHRHLLTPLCCLRLPVLLASPTPAVLPSPSSPSSPLLSLDVATASALDLLPSPLFASPTPLLVSCLNPAFLVVDLSPAAQSPSLSFAPGFIPCTRPILFFLLFAFSCLSHVSPHRCPIGFLPICPFSTSCHANFGDHQAASCCSRCPPPQLTDASQSPLPAVLLCSVLHPLASDTPTPPVFSAFNPPVPFPPLLPLRAATSSHGPLNLSPSLLWSVAWLSPDGGRWSSFLLLPFSPFSSPSLGFSTLPSPSWFAYVPLATCVPPPSFSSPLPPVPLICVPPPSLLLPSMDPSTPNWDLELPHLSLDFYPSPGFIPHVVRVQRVNSSHHCLEPFCLSHHFVLVSHFLACLPPLHSSSPMFPILSPPLSPSLGIPPILGLFCSWPSPIYLWSLSYLLLTFCPLRPLSIFHPPLSGFLSPPPLHEDDQYEAQQEELVSPPSSRAVDWRVDGDGLFTPTAAPTTLISPLLVVSTYEGSTGKGLTETWKE
ncbi:hypothetical protein AMTRI_Chr13g122860 [Amborella trichopoda]